MLIALALLACPQSGNAGSVQPSGTVPVPAPIAEVQAPRPVALPSGKAIVRECYSRPEEARKYANRGFAPTGGAIPAPAAQTAAAPKSSAAPTTPVVPLAAPSAVADGLGYGSAGEGGGGAAVGRAGAGKGGAKAEADASSAPDVATREKKESAPRRDAAVTEDEMSAPPEPVARARPSEPDLDWGATVYLSNDDSMSLASAQRLLWAVQQRGPVQASEVRPHELLNYFSFDTAAPTGSDLFGVSGSALVTGDQSLTVAFAVKGAAPERGPLDLTLVLDRSGSMSAEGRMEYLKRGLRKMTAQLHPGDRVDLVLFDDTLCTPLEDFVVGRDDASLLASAIDRLQPRGSTDLDLGLREGYRIASARPRDAARTQRVMLISDALLNTGDIDRNTVSEVAKQYEERDVRLTAVGVGRDFNDGVLDMLSEKGKGAYVYLGSEAVVDRLFGVGFDALVQTIAHDVHFSIDLPPSLAMGRFYGEEASTTKSDVQPIHYYAGTSQLFLQDLQIRGALVGSDPVTFTIEWEDADTGEAREQHVKTTVGALVHADPRNVRKGRALMAWTDLILARALGDSPCGAPFATWQERVGALGADAEVGWLDGLTSPLCGALPVEPKPVSRGVAYKVKVDTDVPIAEVALACGGSTLHAALSGSDTVARFDAASPGACTLTLGGIVPMQAKVQVPTTGGDTRCVVRGGRVSCT